MYAEGGHVAKNSIVLWGVLRAYHRKLGPITYAFIPSSVYLSVSVFLGLGRDSALSEEGLTAVDVLGA